MKLLLRHSKSWFLFATIILLTTSCKEDECEGITCQNGGACKDGACACPEGFKGSFCESVDYAKYIFVNNAPSPITLWVGLSGPFTVASGSSYTHEGELGSSFEYYAETYGKTSTGAQVGGKVSWTNTKIFSSMEQTLNLNVSSSLFFLKVENNTGKTLHDLYVNYGLASQTFDNISLTTGKTYSLGYYKAFTNGNVRLYISGTTSYYEWKQGQHYSLPFTENQVITL